MQNSKHIGLPIQCFLPFTLKSKQQYVSSVQNDKREITKYRNLRSLKFVHDLLNAMCWVGHSLFFSEKMIWNRGEKRVSSVRCFLIPEILAIIPKVFFYWTWRSILLLLSAFAESLFSVIWLDFSLININIINIFWLKTNSIRFKGKHWCNENSNHA